jgi:hypothetical protein
VDLVAFPRQQSPQKLCACFVVVSYKNPRRNRHSSGSVQKEGR